TTEDLTDEADSASEIGTERWPGVYGRNYESDMETVSKRAEALMQRRGWIISKLPVAAPEPAEAVPPVSEPNVDGDATEPDMIAAVSKALILGLKTDIVLLMEQRDDVIHVDMRAGSEH